MKWREASRLSHGKLAEENNTKICVHQFVASARARLEWSTIQERDHMFKKNHLLHFKTSNQRIECLKLMIDIESVTDTKGILQHFKAFFASLAHSNVVSNEQTVSSPALSEMENLSYRSNKQLLDTEICVEEIEGALKILKLGKSGGPDGPLQNTLYMVTRFSKSG